MRYQKHGQHSGNSGNVFGNMLLLGRLLRPTWDTDYDTTVTLATSSVHLYPKMHFTRKEHLEDLKRDGTCIHLLCVLLLLFFWQWVKSVGFNPFNLNRLSFSRQGFHGWENHNKPQRLTSLGPWEMGSSVEKKKLTRSKCCVCVSVEAGSFKQLLVEKVASGSSSVRVHWCLD